MAGNVRVAISRTEALTERKLSECWQQPYATRQLTASHVCDPGRGWTIIPVDKRDGATCCWFSERNERGGTFDKTGKFAWHCSLDVTHAFGATCGRPRLYCSKHARRIINNSTWYKVRLERMTPAQREREDRERAKRKENRIVAHRERERLRSARRRKEAKKKAFLEASQKKG